MCRVECLQAQCPHMWLTPCPFVCICYIFPPDWYRRKKNSCHDFCPNLYTHKTVILPVVLYGCETRSLNLREKHRLRVFENKVTRKIFGAKRDEITGVCRTLHNTELHAVYSSLNIIRNLKARRLRWAGYVTRMEQYRNAQRVLVGKSEGKRPLGRPRRRSSSSPLSPSRSIEHPQSASSESYSEPTSSPLPMSFLLFQFPLQLFFSKSVSVFLSAYSLEDPNLMQSSQLIHCLFLMHVVSNSISVSLFQI